MAEYATAGTTQVSDSDLALRRHVEGRLLGLRVNRYSWWTHARELADYILPRRYKWLITPNQMARGSPINQHIIDSTGTLAARNLAAGMMYGITSPTKPWFKLKIGHIDSTQTTPVSLWLAECERLMRLVFQESNIYTSLAIMYFDLVVFGTGVILIYEDFENVIHCFNPCFGEFYVDNDGQMRPLIFYREFTLTLNELASMFGLANISPNNRRLVEQGGSNLTREIIVAHAIEPNDAADGGRFGFPSHFKFRECYWEWGGSASPQGGSAAYQGFLRKRGFNEQPNITIRWDLTSNDAYGRSPGMDALPDIKQLQLEVRRKAQAIDKHVNPPMVADMQLKNQPASLLPGGVTYVSGMMANKSPGFVPAYGNWTPDTKAISEDIALLWDRIKRTFFNDLFQTISQYQTRSNVTAAEIDARRAESLVMLGPVLNRVINEGPKVIIERVFAIMSRVPGLLPPPPAEISGSNIEIEFVSVLATAQDAAAASGIERLLAMVGNVAGLDPAAADNVDIDYALDKMSSLLNNDPKLIRSPAQLAQIRNDRAKQQAMQQQAEMAEKMAAGAKTLSETQIGGGQNALQAMTGVG